MKIHVLLHFTRPSCLSKYKFIAGSQGRKTSFDLDTNYKHIKHIHKILKIFFEMQIFRKNN